MDELCLGINQNVKDVLLDHFEFQAYRRFYKVLPGLQPNPASPHIVLYHHVAHQENKYVKLLGITMSPQCFNDHIQYITHNFDVIPFSRLESESAYVVFSLGRLSFYTSCQSATF